MDFLFTYQSHERARFHEIREGVVIAACEPNGPFSRTNVPRIQCVSHRTFTTCRAAASRFACENGQRKARASPSRITALLQDMSGTVSERYAALVAAGEIEHDPAQAAVAARLSRLADRLAHHRLTRKSSSLGWLFASRDTKPLKGLYVFGDVGRGKTMLMDLFYAAAPVVRRRRTHFHAFMLDVHERVHAFRQQLKRGEVKGDDPIVPVAEAIGEEAWLLCFDEFHVTDIADAMILGRLFTRLFEQGVVVVATSNVAPDDLYQDGLNRALFLPFLSLLKDHMDVVRLEARTDFRLEKLAGVP